MKSVDERLVELESQLAHASHFSDQLNRVVVEHTRSLTSLERECRRLRERIAELESFVAKKGGDTDGAGEGTEGHEYGLDEHD